MITPVYSTYWIDLCDNIERHSTEFLEQLNQGKVLIDETAVMVNRLKDGSLSQDELEGFLGKLNYSLVGGAIVGAFGVIIANELLNKNKE